MKKPRPTTIEKLQAKASPPAPPAAPPIGIHDIRNLTIAARRALGGLPSPSLQHVGESIAVAERLLAFHDAQVAAAKAAKPAAPAPPAAEPPAAPKPNG